MPAAVVPAVPAAPLAGPARAGNKRAARSAPKQAKLFGVGTQRSTTGAQSSRQTAASSGNASGASAHAPLQQLHQHHGAGSAPADHLAAINDQSSSRANAPLAPASQPSVMPGTQSASATPSQLSTSSEQPAAARPCTGEPTNGAQPSAQSNASASQTAQASAMSRQAAAAQWKQIQGKFKPVRCRGHNEDCKMQQVCIHTTGSSRPPSRQQ